MPWPSAGRRVAAPDRHASAGIAFPSLTARDVTPLAVARARPPARASTRARSSRSRASGAPRYRLSTRGALIGFPLGVPAHHPPPRARAPACGALVPGALQRARRAGPHVPLPVTRAASTRLCTWPLAGNGVLPSPDLSFSASLRFAGAPRTPPGRFRALHITRALCATGARGARTNSRARGLGAGAGEWSVARRAPDFRARLRRGRCRRVTLRASLRARHLRFSLLRVLDPARGHGPRRAGPVGRASGARPSAARVLPAWHERAARVG